jgi:hypothetical protein
LRDKSKTSSSCRPETPLEVMPLEAVAVTWGLGLGFWESSVCAVLRVAMCKAGGEPGLGSASRGREGGAAVLLALGAGLMLEKPVS